jgi:PAS domain S-box-containing protein
MAAASEYVLEPIRNRAEFTLYRARQHGNPSPILVVAPTAEQPLPESLRRLEHEYSLEAELEPAWAAKPLALTRHEGRTILVLADPGGEPLDRVLERDRERPLDLARLLRLAINLATALGHAHQRGLMHKDIKPENVLVDDAGHVWLTGFGLASRLPRERQAPAEIIAGTLAYMSPEQTGRMNRSMDTRSDLYSLGVTLYQMLTGVLPFAAADPLEWVHCHIARQPVAPADRRAVPEPLSAITMKLLAKNAEERYQTAAGLEADLRRCLSEWQSHGRIDPFPLGTDDSSDRLLIPEKLYGREREVDALLTAFDRVVAQGTAEFVLVSGYSGVGKSSVVNELHKVLVPPRGLFAAGKFDQYKRDVPYATLAQAFQMLVRQILVKSEAEVEHWRHALLEALGPNGQLMVNLIPELEFVIGKQAPVAELPPQEARGRFQLVFRRFLGAFARPEHPLALFLDDLQWLDTATLELLERMVTDPDVRHVLLIGAYRDNEVSSSHPLMRTLAAIRDAGAKAQEIVLAPLELDDVERLIADALRCGSNSAGPLALLVYEKTGGNPFFTIQFLMALAEEGLLRFDSDAPGWIWDLDRIRAKGYSGNVVDLMLAKLRRLPQPTQTALQQLACLGNIVEIATLNMVFGQSEEAIHTALLEAARTGLILRLEGSYAFLHDRIREAAYALIPEAQRAEVHLRIGRLQIAHTPPEEREEAIFEIVNQFNLGAELITAEIEHHQLAELNLVAGKRAKASTAYASALKYFIVGEAFLKNDPWERRHDLIFELELHRAECEFLTGELIIAAERMEMLRSRASNTVERARATCLGIDVYLTLGQVDRAVAIGLEYLRRFATDWPLHPTEEQARSEYERIWSQLGDREIEEIIDFPLMSDPASIATLDVLTKVVTPAMFTDKDLYALVICRAASLSIEHGNNDGSCMSYVWLSMIAGFRFSDHENASRFGQLGYQLVEKRGLKRFQAATYNAFAACTMPWMKHLRTCCDVIRQAFEIANKIGDLTWAAYSRIGLNTLLIATGEPLIAVQSEAEYGLNFAWAAKFSLIADMFKTELGLIRTLRGLTTTFGSFDHAGFEEIPFERHLASHPAMATAECWYWIRKLQARLFAGDFVSAIDASLKARPLLLTSPGFDWAEYEFYSALARAALWNSTMADQRREHFEALGAHYARLKVWAEHCPENFEDRATLVGAEIARLEKRDADALHLYEQAIHSARDNGFVQDEGLAHELAAQYYLAQGLETAGYAHLRNARNCYDCWGAHGKVRQLDERYPRLGEERPSTSSARIGPSVGQLDVETVVKASQALSSEMILPQLIEKLVRIAVEHAGAQRGLLILFRGGEPRIEAEATTGPGNVEVVVRQAAVTPSDLPQSTLHYVIRTQASVLLDDASADNAYSKDEYVQRKRSRSVLCLPIVKQGKLVGAIYLENNLTASAFTPDRVTVLQLLASQAAISLENADLYSDLEKERQNFRLIVDTVPGFLCTMTARGQVEFVNQRFLDYTGWTLEQLADWRPLLHPDEREMVMMRWIRSVETGNPYDIEHHIRGADGFYRWFMVSGLPVRDAEGSVVRWYVSLTDIHERKAAEEKVAQQTRELATLLHKIRGSEAELRRVIDTIPTLAWCNLTDGSNEFMSKRWHDYTGLPPEKSNGWGWQVSFHPEDLPPLMEKWRAALASGEPDETEARIRRYDGTFRWFLIRVEPFRDGNGRILRWYGTSTDIEDRKRAEETLRQNERELRQITDSTAQIIIVEDAEGVPIYANRAVFDYTGLTIDDITRPDFRPRICHPEDLERLREERNAALSRSLPFEIEQRVLRKDGQYRWFLIRYNPFHDERGRIIRWYATGADIEDRKQAQERTHNENLALREEIDKASMFEEMVGTSTPLKKVLSRISKVAPTDSSVLITGETGTGKELVARAIHRRSRRASHAFVSVNCAAIPRDLIASELFGHEKGAFTGATQRRLGRFEVAEKGTIFLDEVGELPAETQITLLRVLQEREFERIGGSGSIRADVRVIAATNRDLESAIESGTFRGDLFYRLNVFPIELPPLRKRTEDIPLLVTYFLNRYARKAGRHFTAVDKKSHDLLRSYAWPGNIRELQNVIERSVIVNESEIFSVDESWLSRRPSASDVDVQSNLFNRFPAQEKAVIEAALRECGGRVYGPSGAAAKLDIPRTTLESKIRSLKINKNRFKGQVH